MDNDYLLTTIDNPYDPYRNFEEWYTFDCIKGHNTCSLLDRIMLDVDSLSDQQQEEEYNRAAEEIIKNDPFDKYIKFFKHNKYAYKPAVA